MMDYGGRPNQNFRKLSLGLPLLCSYDKEYKERAAGERVQGPARWPR